MHQRAMRSEKRIAIVESDRNTCESLLLRRIPFGKSMGDISRLIIEDTEALVSSLDKGKSAEPVEPVDINAIFNTDLSGK